MKLLLVGDLHIQDSKPKRRIDDFYKVQLEKFDFILNTAAKHNAIILQAGDFFDTPRTSKKLISEIAEKIKLSSIEFIAIYGQHDTFFHSDKIENTSLNILRSSGLVDIDNNYHWLKNDVSLHCCNWWQNRDIPKPIDNKFNILLIHKMIIDEKLWDKQEATNDHEILATGHDLIISGDNHKSFMLEKDERFLFNPGSIFRTKINQIDHKPRIVLFDTKTRRYENIYLPVNDNVFDLTNYEQENQRKEKMDSFVNGLDSESIQGLKFEENMSEYLIANRIDGLEKEIIIKAMI